MYLDVLHQDVLELREEELILLQDKIQQTSDVLTLTEVQGSFMPSVNGK